MKSQIFNQKGFGVVEILLVIVVVGVIGFVGWMAYGRQNNTSDSLTDNSSAQEQQTKIYERSTSVPNDWKAYSNDKYKIALSYPAGWTVSDSVFNKDAGDDVQNVYSVDATEIFVICYQSSNDNQSCSQQININNQNFAQSLDQLRSYYTNNSSLNPYTETELMIDGHRVVEFRVGAKDGFPAQKEYLVDANGYSYGLTTVYEGEPADGNIQEPSSQDSLTLFESIKID